MTNKVKNKLLGLLTSVDISKNTQQYDSGVGYLKTRILPGGTITVTIDFKLTNYNLKKIKQYFPPHDEVEINLRKVRKVK